MSTRLTDEQAAVARDDWEVPPALFRAYDGLYRFAIDVAANTGNRCCRDYYDREADGLVQSWKRYVPEPKTGESILRSVWCHPPHSDPGPWMSKAVREAQQGVTVVSLIPSTTSSDWWHDFVLPNASIRFLRGQPGFRLGRIPLTEKGQRAALRGPSQCFAIAVFKPGKTLRRMR